MSDDATDWSAVFLGFGFFIVGAAGYLLPAVVAMARRHPKGNVIAAANFLFPGLSVFISYVTPMGDRDPIDWQILLSGAIVFWLILLVWAFSPFKKPEKPE